jgi:hypothetical protein
MRRLNRHVERVFDPSRKDPRWTKRTVQRSGDKPQLGCRLGDDPAQLDRPPI